MKPVTGIISLALIAYMDNEELLNALADLFETASKEPTGADVLELGILSTTEIAAFQKKINKNLARFRKVIKFNEARHIIKMHSKSYERLNRQVEISAEHFMNIPDVLLTYTDIIFQPKDHAKGKYQDSILFTKGNYSIVCDLIYGKKELAVKTMWVKK